jgi:hypothetical protein
VTLLDDLVPTPLHAFTPDTLTTLRTAGKSESLFFEFKSAWAPEDVTRCACAFANAQGGFLMFGVQQTQAGSIESFPGLDEGPEYPTLAKDRIIGHISPLPFWDAITTNSPDHPDRVVLVMRIPPSDRTPHVTRTGVIYIRTPAACDPVRDRATIDHLASRGRDAESYFHTRRLALHSLPWRRQRNEGTWEMVVAAVPSPGLPGAYRHFISAGGYNLAASLFSDRSGRPTPERPLEDGVLLRHGRAELACLADGSMVYRIQAPTHDGVRGAWVQQMTEKLLVAQRSLTPEVRQAYVSVELIGVGGLKLVSTDAFGFEAMSEESLPGDWSYWMETLTDDGSAARAGRLIRRRLWRAAGEAEFEPGDVT